MIKSGYILFTFLYPFGAKLLSLAGNQKAKLWIEGRKDIFTFLQTRFEGNTLPVIWFHCASLGEFEQGRPVMEELTRLYPNYKLLVTFFSPSGYEIKKNYPMADVICYLPMDGKNMHTSS